MRTSLEGFPAIVTNRIFTEAQVPALGLFWGCTFGALQSLLNATAQRIRATGFLNDEEWCFALEKA